MIDPVSLFSYGPAACAYLALAVALQTRWRARAYRPSLVLACLVSTAWAACGMLQNVGAGAISLAFDAAELLRGAAWSALLLVLVAPAKPPAPRPLRAARNACLLLYALLLVATLCVHLWPDAGPTGASAALALLVGRVVAAVAGMLLVEQLFFHSSSEEHWGIKFACVGIGALFAFDFYLYSDALLFRQLDARIWSARGLVNAAIVPLIAISVMRNTNWSLRLALSRRMLLRSTTVSMSALYLLTISGAGYYLRYFGGNWGAIVQTALLFAGALGLVLVLGSGSSRAWLKVFLSKHFYHYNYDYREEWMRFTRTLSEPGPGLERRAVQAIAQLVESPAGALFIKGEPAHYEVGADWHTQLGQVREPADSPFCQLLHREQWLIELGADGASVAPTLSTLPAWLALLPDAWLVVPLTLKAELFGFIVLCRPRSKIALNWEVRDLLKIAGTQAAGNLAQQRAAQALLVARQFESYNRMSTFVVHDLKNLVSQLSLLLENAERHHASPAFQRDMRDTVAHSVARMRHLLARFHRDAAFERPAPVLLEKAARQALAQKGVGTPTRELDVLDPDLLVRADQARLERVIGHLIQNAIEASPRDGRIGLRLLRERGNAVLELRDQGCGMSELFIRERLFTPFESTKAAGMGIGVFESREYIQELGGSLDVVSEPAVGTCFRIALPLLGRDTPVPAN